MKKLLLLVCIIGSIAPLIAKRKKRAQPVPHAQPIKPAQPAQQTQQSWTTVSAEQAEYNRLSLECSRIAERFVAITNSTMSSPSLHTAIFSYLKNVGTPTSLRVLRDQIAAGRVPASYLNQI